MGEGTRVGESQVSINTTKNVLVRLQAPRFFIETDEVVISANIHNYLPVSKRVTAKLELAGSALHLVEPSATSTFELESQGERRLAESVSRFVEEMRPPRTDRELMIEQLLECMRPRDRTQELTR